MSQKWMPIKVSELDLSQKIQPIKAVEGYSGLYVLVRYQGYPIGWIYISDLGHHGVISPAQLRQTINKQIGWVLVPLVLGDQLEMERAEAEQLDPISIVVYLHSLVKVDQFQWCLQGLAKLDYPIYEIIIVSNSTQADYSSQFAVDFPIDTPLRFIYEERIGLNRARNRGLAEARYDIIAFIDGTTYPDRAWLQTIANTLARPEVMAVTGLVAPAELETEAQIRLEFNYIKPEHGLRRQIIRQNSLTNSIQRNKSGAYLSWLWRGGLTDQELLWANHFGLGSNMAFRRDLFTAIGPFDMAMDLDTFDPDHGATEIFHRLITRGHTLAYEPAALVWHKYQHDRASLRRSIYQNGRSFGVYLLTCMRNRTLSRRAILHFALIEWLIKGLLYRLIRPKSLPRGLIFLELTGAMMSPFAYLVAQIQTRLTANKPSQGGNPSPQEKKMSPELVRNTDRE